MQTQKAIVTVVSPLSRKIRHHKKPRQAERFAAKEPQIPFYLDAVLCYRIYGDFLIPNSDFETGDHIYHFKKHLAFKTISQIHQREKGTVIHFNDMCPESITPLEILQSRLNNLKAKNCQDLAEFLPLYYNFYQNAMPTGGSIKVARSIENDPLVNDHSTFGFVLTEIDKIFEFFKDDMVIISVYHLQNGFDGRLQMLSFNKELEKCVSSDAKGDAFELGTIDKLLEVFVDYSIKNYIKEFTDFLKSFPIKASTNGLKGSEDFFERDMQTSFGITREKIRLQSYPISINGWNFNLICSILKREEQSIFLKSAIQNKKMEFGLQKNELKNNKDWAKMYSCYYPNLKP